MRTEKNRRFFLAALAATFLGNGHALAAPVTVKIIAMPHPPVIRALKPLRDWLSSQAGKITVSEIDAENAHGVKRLAGIGLSGHIPVAILIDGSPNYRRKDGKTLRFVNFPAVPDSPPGARGDWLTEDVRAAITERMNKP